MCATAPADHEYRIALLETYGGEEWLSGYLPLLPAVRPLGDPSPTLPKGSPDGSQTPTEPLAEVPISVSVSGQVVQQPQQQEDDARARKSRSVDPDELPPDFPTHLRPVAKGALAKLLAIQAERGGDVPTLRGVGLAIKLWPDRPHADVVDSLEHWAMAGRGREEAVKDWASTLRTFLRRTPAGAPSRPSRGRPQAVPSPKQQRAAALIAEMSKALPDWPLACVQRHVHGLLLASHDVTADAMRIRRASRDPDYHSPSPDDSQEAAA